MRGLKPVFVATMIFATASLTLLSLIIFGPYSAYTDTPCPDGRYCPDLWRCCEHGCCVPSTLTPLPTRRENEAKGHPYVQDWYWNWPILFLAGILAGLCACGAWRLCCRSGARQCSCMFACCMRRPTSNHDSAGSCYPPPHYSRCGSFHQAPPPYSEVTSKPDLYPLVITCGEGDNKGAGNYLMVHYFRNYVIRAPGSLSATSTAESLNSSFICNAANEANSIIPPPYSCASNYSSWGGGGGGAGTLLRSLSSLTEPRALSPSPPLAPLAPLAPDLSPDDAFRGTLITSPAQPGDSQYNLELDLIDYEMCRESGCKPRLGSSPPMHSPSQNLIFEHDFERLLFTHSASGSPPRPTSPTQSSRESTLGRSSEDRQPRRPDSVKKCPKSRKTSLYMPLSSVYPVRSSRMSPGSRMSSRSAPATPCGALVPNLLALSQRVSSSRQGSKASRLEEENDPLLSDDNGAPPDHKF